MTPLLIIHVVRELGIVILHCPNMMSIGFWVKVILLVWEPLFAQNQISLNLLLDSYQTPHSCGPMKVNCPFFVDWHLLFMQKNTENYSLTQASDSLTLILTLPDLVYVSLPSNCWLDYHPFLMAREESYFVEKIMLFKDFQDI